MPLESGGHVIDATFAIFPVVFHYQVKELVECRPLWSDPAKCAVARTSGVVLCIPQAAHYSDRRPRRFCAVEGATESTRLKGSSNATGTCRNRAVAAKPLSKVTTCAP